jgi:phosphoribosylglycinamide formyltransferase-1
MKNIVVFASGSGTNTENIIRYFEKSDAAKVNLVVCNDEKAGVVERVKKLSVACYIISDVDLQNPESLIEMLRKNKPSLIVLAGFLKLVPAKIISTYRGRIINIHPALLPRFGGKGMYGSRVHRAVIDAGEKESGITIHLVNEKFDEGEIIFQKKISLEKNETKKSLAEKIHELEYEHYPFAIQNFLKKID